MAAELQDEFADGVWFVNLAPIADARRISSLIARTLGVEEHGDEPLLDQITSSLGARQLLLLVDNVEHLAEGAAPCVR